MSKIGGYMCVEIVNNGTKKMFKKANKSNPKAIYMFVAGGKEIDQKVELANQKLLENNTLIKQTQAPKTVFLYTAKKILNKFCRMSKATLY